MTAILEAVLDAVDAAMRAESDRLASAGTTEAVEQGIGVAHAMTPVRDAIREAFARAAASSSA